jgi:hypothetical protein
MDDLISLGPFAPFLLLVFLLYFSPTVLAYLRSHPRRRTILLANFFLGPLAFFFAISPKDDRATPVEAPVEGGLECSSCGHGYLPGDYREDAAEWSCSRCGGDLPKSAA